MALDTQKNYRNLVMYSVFVRNHTKEGTFRALVSDLDRIKALGVDIVWLMPIHPRRLARRPARARSAAPTPSATIAP